MLSLVGYILWESLPTCEHIDKSNLWTCQIICFVYISLLSFYVLVLTIRPPQSTTASCILLISTVRKGFCVPSSNSSNWNIEVDTTVSLRLLIRCVPVAGLISALLLSMSAGRDQLIDLDMQCQPLKTLIDIQGFIRDPPAWRSLCKPLTPHHTELIRNSSLISEEHDEISLDSPHAFCHFDPENVRTPEWVEERLLPKTLLCHDMANGYHDDSVIDGTGQFDAYTFYNWAGVDIFCYFSHHLVTVPPLGWINVAHAHGVKVIGTVITEWANGLMFWNKVLACEEDMQTMISSLVTIAKTLKFEGWLLNVENKVSEPAKLLSFVRQLHATLRSEVPGAVLLWYDSVTVDGDLSWQNKLNDKNKPFFDACDGIFLNYSWSEQDVADSVAAAGARVRDLYVGIDVWGRNFYGGGMFNTRTAANVAHARGCSLAVFAPAWTHEALGADGDVSHPQAIVLGELLSRHERWLLRDRALWGSLWPFLATRVPASLPFKTSFCRGAGKRRRMYGEVLCNSPWYNLRHMQYQPNSALGPHGYLLAAEERLLHVARGAARDPVQGIVKYRQALRELNQQVLDQERARVSQKMEEDDEEEEHAAEKDGKQVTKEGEQGQAGRGGEASRGRLRYAFDRLLRNQPPPPSPPELAQPGAEETNLNWAEATSQSMVNMAVQTNLRSCMKRTRLRLAFVAEERECLHVYLADCYHGGSCLMVNPSDHVAQQHRTVRLLHCSFPLEARLVVCVVTKNLPGFSHQYLTLLLAGAGERAWSAVLEARLEEPELPREGSQAAPPPPPPPPPPSEPLPAPPARPLAPLRPGSPAFRDLQTYLVLHEPGFYEPVENAFGWNVFYFQLQPPRGRLTTLSLRTAESEGPMLLGLVALCARPPPRPQPLYAPRDNPQTYQPEPENSMSIHFNT